MQSFDFLTTPLGSRILIDNNIEGVYVGYVQPYSDVYCLFIFSSPVKSNLDDWFLNSPIYSSISNRGFSIPDRRKLDKIIEDNSNGAAYSFDTSLYNPQKYKNGIWIALDYINQYNICNLNPIDIAVKQIISELQ